MIKVILIDGPSQKIYPIDIAPSHWAVEEEIGTRFWVMRRLSRTIGGDVFYHAEGRNKGYEDFTFDGIGYSGCGLVCHSDWDGVLESTQLTLDDVLKRTTFPEPAARGPWPFPRGDHGKES